MLGNVKEKVRKEWERQRLAAERRMRDRIVDAFHRFWYDAADSWKASKFLGFGLQQFPCDLQIYHDILTEVRPAFLVQTGVLRGGSIVFFANLFDALGLPPEVPVIGVDIKLTDEAKKISHPRVHLIEGSSTAPETLARVRQLLPAGKKGFVSLDSDHSRDHVLREMQLYSELVEVGSFMVVEDTNVNGHPVFPEHGPGPFEAVELFFRERSDFVPDDCWKRMIISFHQGGWLRKVR